MTKSIFEVMNQLIYKNKEEIFNTLIDLKEKDQSLEIYLRKIGTSQYYIYLIKILKNSVKFTIHLLDGYPKIPPKTFLFLDDNTVLNINKNNYDVNAGTFEIKTKMILYYNPSHTLESIINEINSSFEKNIPYFGFSYLSNNVYNSDNSNYSFCRFISNVDFKAQLFNEESESNKKTNSINSLEDDKIKEILINEIIDEDFYNDYKFNISRILDERKVLIELDNEIKDSIVYKNRLYEMIKISIAENDNQINKNLKILEKEEETLKIKKNMSNLMKNIDLFNLDDYLKISSNEKRILELISLESSLEDIYLYVKKLIDKNMINFDNAVIYIRYLTNEIGKVKFLRSMMS